MKQQGVRQRRTPPATLGPMLGTARLRAGLRGAEAARSIGVSHAYLVYLETGQRCPSRAVAESIAAVLDLDDAERAELFAAALDDVGRSHPGKRTPVPHFP